VGEPAERKECLEAAEVVPAQLPIRNAQKFYLLCIDELLYSTV